MEIRILAALAVGGVLLAAVLITVAAALLYSRLARGSGSTPGRISDAARVFGPGACRKMTSSGWTAYLF